ncbi:general substrate transporter [Hysterangium stoloniferum]|nr:general substrate transporter [Hysterangium stoloniferum]
MAQPSVTLSSQGWQTAIWMLATSLQYGWHISALNQIQAALTCRPPHKAALTSFFPSCIKMDDFQFSLVTAAFTVGGLLGSIGADRSMDLLGRKSSIRLNTVMILLGASLMTVSASVPPLVIGRLFVGIGSGLGLCVVPAYLSEISPPAIKGSVGVLNQLGIVVGILLTQIFGIFLSAPTLWRFIPLIAAAFALAQLLLSPLAVDSPAWLSVKHLPDAKIAATLLWASREVSHEEEGLLPHEYIVNGDNTTTPASVGSITDSPTRSTQQGSPTWAQLLRPPLRQPLVLVCLGMIAQQISGVNAVLYYSNDILSRVLPDAAAYVSLGITVVNAIMTFPPIYLIERVGRRSLITWSAMGAIISLFAVGYGINNGAVFLASVAVLAFIASFAIGLGPVPYVIISDVTPYHAVSTVSSIALSLNWIANFLVGIGFLPLRNYLAGGEADREGRVFYVFGAILLVVYILWAKAYMS